MVTALSRGGNRELAADCKRFVNVHKGKHAIGYIPNLFEKKLSPKLSKQPRFAAMKLYKSCSSLVKENTIFFHCRQYHFYCFRYALNSPLRIK